MKKIFLFLTILSLFSQFSMGQEIRAELSTFIEQQLEKNSSKSSLHAAEYLCSQISDEYGLKDLDPIYTSFISSVLDQERKHKVKGEIDLLRISLYQQAIASVFLSEHGKIEAKNLACDRARRNLNTLLQQLPGATADLMDCIQDQKKIDANEVYEDIDFWRSQIIQFLLDPSKTYKTNPHKPHACEREISWYQYINNHLMRISEICE